MKKATDSPNKPYNRCLSCAHRGDSCDGPRTAGLPLARWKEYMRDLKEINGLTNADVAERSELTVKTIERALSPASDQDIMRETARKIENAIMGSTSRYPCYLAFQEENEPEEGQMLKAMSELKRLTGDNEEYKKIQEEIHDSYQKEMAIIRAEGQRKVEFLLEQLANAREDCVYWRNENNRKNRVIDQFMQKGTNWMIVEDE